MTSPFISGNHWLEPIWPSLVSRHPFCAPLNRCRFVRVGLPDCFLHRLLLASVT